jgi:hypothetical protein
VVWFEVSAVDPALGTASAGNSLYISIGGVSSSDVIALFADVEGGIAGRDLSNFTPLLEGGFWRGTALLVVLFRRRA